MEPEKRLQDRDIESVNSDVLLKIEPCGKDDISKRYTKSLFKIWTFNKRYNIIEFPYNIAG